MEYSNEHGKVNAGLTTGIIGTAGFGLQLLNGLLNGGMGASPACSDDHWVNRYEAAQSAKIAELETEVKLRDANTYTLGEVGKLRDYVERKFDKVEHELCEQRAYNAVNTSTLTCMQSQIAQLQGLSKLVIPITSICPEPAVATTSA